MVRWLAIAGLVSGCEGLIPESAEESECDLSYENLDGRTFAAVEALGSVDRVNPVARVKFETKDGETVAKYTVASLSDVYEFPCKLKEKGDSRTLLCAEKARPMDWCQALLVGDAVCSKKVLRKFGAEGTDEELNAEIKTAKENWRKYRGTENEKQFVLNNNNLGNKLQGRLYVDIDDKRCKMTIGDFYWTIYNGKGIEDSNPVGQNLFAEVKEDYLFEHCKEGNIMPGVEMENLPDDLSFIPPTRRYAAGRDYWYHYLGEKNIQAEAGCTYSFDVWANFKKVSEGNPAPVVKDQITWKFKHAFGNDDQVVMWGDQTRPLGVITMIRYKECGGKKEKMGAVCEAGLLVEAVE